MVGRCIGLILVTCGRNGGFVGTNCFVGFVGSVESGEGGGFVGTKRFVERAFNLGTDVDGGGEVQQDGFFSGCLGTCAGAEVAGDLGDGFVVFGREFEGLAGAEIVGGGIGRTSGFAFGSARPLPRCQVRFDIDRL